MLKNKNFYVLYTYIINKCVGKSYNAEAETGANLGLSAIFLQLIR